MLILRMTRIGITNEFKSQHFHDKLINRVIIGSFATAKGLQMLGNGKKWYMDEIFKSMPKTFCQLVTFHTKHPGRHWLCVCCLCDLEVHSDVHAHVHRPQDQVFCSGVGSKAMSTLSWQYSLP